MAILFAEEDALVFARALAASSIKRLSAASFVEAAILADRRGGPEASSFFDALIAGSDVVIEPLTARQAELARIGHSRFGRGVHPAALNLGDCFTYALAKTFDEPLLFKGDDFSKTDVLMVDLAPFRVPLG